MMELLADIREKLKVGAYKNEEQIRLTLVVRVLDALGWDIWNPEEVFPEFIAVPNEDKTRVDIALFLQSDIPSVFIEVKAHKLLMGKLEEVEKQVRDYNRNNTAPFSLLTDGQNWRFYLSQTGGVFSQKCFQDFDLFTADLEEVYAILNIFLSKNSHRDGTAKSQAQELLQLSQKQRNIFGMREEALKMMAIAPFPRLPEALLTLAEQKGITTTIEEVEDILVGKMGKPRPIAAKPLSPAKPPVQAPVLTLNSPIGLDLVLDPSRPDDLGHTKVMEAALNGQPIKNWKQLALAAIKLGHEHQLPLPRLGQNANISATPRSDSGFEELPGTSLWVQGMDANKCWKTAFDLAKHLKIPIKVIFSWREKENVANAGKTALLEWKPD